MKQSLVLLVVLFLLALGAGVAYFLLGTSEPSALHQGPPVSAAPAGDAATTVEGAGETALAAAGRQPEQRAEAVGSRAVEYVIDSDLDAERATRVSGTVISPRGAPEDDLLRVYALSRSSEYDGFTDTLQAAPFDLDENARLGEWVHSSAPVADDGTFSVLFPETTARGWLLVVGRYQYTKETLELLLPTEESFVLEPKLACALEGQVVLPEGTDVELLEGIEVGFRIDTASAGPGTDPTETLEVEVKTDASGRFEVYGIPPDYTWMILAGSEELAATKALVTGLVPGETTEFSVQIAEGGGVFGVVRNAEGGPVAGAKVVAVLHGAWFGFDDLPVRRGETDGQGEFRLRAVPAGPIGIKADHPAYLASRRVTTEVVAGSTNAQPLEIELTDGRVMRGSVEWLDGSPAKDVDVKVRFDPAFLAGPSAFNALRGAEADVKTDAEGRFTARGMGGGPFVVQAATPPRDATPEQREDEETWFRALAEGVSPSEEVELVLRPPIGLAGVVIGPDEEPVPEFTVHAERRVDGSFGSVSSERRDEKCQDQEGRFLLSNLKQGTWELRVKAEGMLTPEPVTVKLPRTGDDLRIRLVLTASVAGVVLSPNGTPVSEAEVVLDTGQPSWQGLAPNAAKKESVRTDESGVFLFEYLTPGSVSLYADHQDWGRGESVAFELEPGGIVEDAELRLIRGGTLTGLVYGKDGEPSKGQFIMANKLDLEQRFTNADSNGEFVIEHLPSGSWQVIAMDRQSDFSADDSGAFNMSAMQMTQAEIVEGEVTHVVIGAPPADPVKVFGKVEHDGKPYTGASVVWYPQGSKLYERMKFATVSGEGEYSITLDGPGEYVVFVQKLGRTQAQQENLEFTVEIPAAEEFQQDFEVPLGRISGRVLDQDGSPAVNARVTLANDGGFRSDALFGGQYSEVLTDGEGRYDLQGLRPGTYMISAGGAALFDFGGTMEVTVGRVTIGGVRLGEDEWKKDFDFELQGPGAIQVSVVGLDGEPVDAASVFVRDSAGRPTEPFNFAPTSATGVYTARGLAPGDYTLVARKGLAVSPESPPVRVIAGETTKLELRLDEGTILWIKLKDREGEDVRASLSVRDSEGREWASFFGMDDLQVLYLDGDFSPTEHRLGPLPPGKYKVVARSGGSERSKPVSLRGEAERKITLRL